MAQRKPPPGGNPAAKKGTSRPAGKPGAAPTAKVSTNKVSTSKNAASKNAASKNTLAKASAASSGRKPPPRKPGKSIVNQKQTPWGTIATVAAVVLFAAAVIIVVVVTHKSSNNNSTGKCPNGSSSRYCLPELAAAKAINGVTYKTEPNHLHVDGNVRYDATPPIGGNHNAYYADCDGTVYPQPIANENAVHPLEHGSVWVTYREGLPQDQVATLAKLVTGQDHVLMSPYPNLSSTVSLQAWGYQLKVNSVTDPRIAQFIATLAGNPKTTPEVDANGAPVTCQNSTFKSHPSTFGHPLSAPQG